MRKINKFNLEAKNNITKLDIHGRVEWLNESNSYNAGKLSFRLINRWKYEIGKFSKNTLQKVVKTSIESTKLICEKIQKELLTG